MQRRHFGVWAAIALASAVAGSASWAQGSYPNAFITMVAVSPQHRKKGLAKSLIAATLSNLSARGFKRCSLEVRRGNTAAINLYHSIGFKGFDPSGDVLRMRIELSA